MTKLYEQPRNRKEAIKQDVILAHATYLCSTRHGNGGVVPSVVCWPCQAEAHTALAAFVGEES